MKADTAIEVTPMAVEHSLTFRGLDENSTMRAILEGTATETGERFFIALVKNISKALNTYSAWVTEYIEESHRLRSLAFWVDGKLIDNFNVDISGTPCENVIKNVNLVHYPDNMMSLFPNNSTIKTFSAVSYMGVPLIDSKGKVLGNLAVLDNQPMPEEPNSQVLFRIFAAQASAELQRLHAEGEIRRREEKYRRIVETAGEGFILMDKNLNIMDVNGALCQLVGVEREELIGKTPLDFATEDFRQFLITNEKELFGGRYKDFEGTVVSASGHDIPILVHGNTLRDDQDKIIGNMAFITDMSEHKKSLKLAGEVQKSLQPQKSPKLQGFDAAGRTISCDEIGGDYYDFLQNHVDSNKLDAVIGDVTGHGVDAALLMTSARAFLRMCVSKYNTISQIITELNHHLAIDFSNTGHFMTMFYMRIDRIKQSLHWVRAGHDPALVYDPMLDKFEELKGTGLALGVDQNYVFEEYLKTDIHGGQIIAIGTDGIWEACNSAGRTFGKTRLKDIIRQNAHLSADEIIDVVFADLNNFSQGLRQTDDITLVVIKVEDSLGSDWDWQI